MSDVLSEGGLVTLEGEKMKGYLIIFVTIVSPFLGKGSHETVFPVGVCSFINILWVTSGDIDGPGGLGSQGCFKIVRPNGAFGFSCSIWVSANLVKVIRRRLSSKQITDLDVITGTQACVDLVLDFAIRDESFEV